MPTRVRGGSKFAYSTIGFQALAYSTHDWHWPGLLAARVNVLDAASPVAARQTEVTDDATVAMAAVDGVAVLVHHVATTIIVAGGAVPGARRAEAATCSHASLLHCSSGGRAYRGRER